MQLAHPLSLSLSYTRRAILQAAPLAQAAQHIALTVVNGSWSNESMESPLTLIRPLLDLVLSLLDLPIRENPQTLLAASFSASILAITETSILLLTRLAGSEWLTPPLEEAAAFILECAVLVIGRYLPPLWQERVCAAASAAPALRHYLRIIRSHGAAVRVANILQQLAPATLTSAAAVVPLTTWTACPALRALYTSTPQGSARWESGLLLFGTSDLAAQLGVPARDALEVTGVVDKMYVYLYPAAGSSQLIARLELGPAMDGKYESEQLRAPVTALHVPARVDPVTGMLVQPPVELRDGAGLHLHLPPQSALLLDIHPDQQGAAASRATRSRAAAGMVTAAWRCDMLLDNLSAFLEVGAMVCCSLPPHPSPSLTASFLHPPLHAAYQASPCHCVSLRGACVLGLQL